MKIHPSIKRFLAYAKPYRWAVAGATLAGILKFNIPVVFPLVLKEIVDHLVSAPAVDFAKINKLMLSVLALYVVWYFASYFRSFWADRTSQRMTFDIRYDLYMHLQGMSLDFYEKRRVGSVTSRLLADISIAQNFIGAAVTNTIMDLTTLAFIAVILFFQNWQLAIVALSIIPIYAVLNSRFQRRIKRTSQLAQEKMETISADVHERLGALPVIQSFTREKTEEKRFFHATRDYLEFLLANVRNNALALSIIGFLTLIAPVMVVWYGVLQVGTGALTPGGLVAFYAYLGMLYTPLNRLTELNIMVANSRSAIERIFEIFDTAPSLDTSRSTAEPEKVEGRVTFEHVQFGYDKHRPLLSDISLDIAPGMTVALIGRSGSGKTTLAKLIPRFYDVTSGKILIDGIDSRDLSLRALRRHIAFVLQEPVLFSGTVAENLRYGRKLASNEDIVKAAQQAHAHEFIMNLPDGYDTLIGERGITLSGGQKQRMALARAFLKDAPILILDEATSALDSESENAIRKACIELMRGRTTFVIAHRLSTIKSADLIAVLDRGRIVQLGNHAQLIQDTNGLYRSLYLEQYAPEVHVPSTQQAPATTH